MVVVIRRALAQASLKWCLELSVHIVIVQFKKNNALQHCLTNKCNVTTVVMCFITKPLTDQHCSRHITVCVSHLIKHKLMQKTLLHSLFKLKIHCKYQTWTLLMRTLLLCVTVVLAIAIHSCKLFWLSTGNVTAYCLCCDPLLYLQFQNT